MRIIQTVEFTTEDRELLKQLLPKNPCDGCGDVIGCCGCPDGRDYAEKVRPYKDANIYDIALTIRRIYDIKHNIRLEEEESEHLKNSIPKELFINCENEKDIQISNKDAMNLPDTNNKTGKWENRERIGDYGNVECSECGYIVANYRAVKIGDSSIHYTGVEYNFCPKCGTKMTV